ncbi:MAG TPA: VOC family protein [Candidatus Binatia bacterium]|nr:VOC family protein [Candidatus Binatia bacterium]
METSELNHVALLVSDVKKSCEFYVSVLQLQQIERPAFDFPGAWFRLGTTQELHLIGGEKTERAAPRRRGNHFALRADDLEAWRQHLQDFGVVARGPVKRPDGAIQIFLSDPDGHLIELFSGP